MALKILFVIALFLFFFTSLLFCTGVIAFFVMIFAGRTAGLIVAAIGIGVAILFSGYMSFPILWHWDHV